MIPTEVVLLSAKTIAYLSIVSALVIKLHFVSIEQEC